MTERERLIELLNTVIYPREGADPAEVVADFLLENGVRLPVTCGECKHSMELKPCPFCGTVPNAYTLKSAGYGEITCSGCFAVFKFLLPKTLAEVKEAWNRRAGND